MSIQCPGGSFSMAKIFHLFFVFQRKKFSWRMPLSLQRFSPIVPELRAADGFGYWDFWPLLWSRVLASSRCLGSRNEIVKLYPRPFSFGSKRAKADRIWLCTELYYKRQKYRHIATVFWLRVFIFKCIFLVILIFLYYNKVNLLV